VQKNRIDKIRTREALFRPLLVFIVN
jgi:hypothetical protein